MIKYCECGCGAIVKDNRRFVQGHNTRLMTLKTKKRIGQSVTEQHKIHREQGKSYGFKSGDEHPMKNPELAKQAGEKKKGKHPSSKTEFKRGSVPHNKGGHHSIETREKMSEKRKGKHQSPATEFKKGRTLTREEIKKCLRRRTMSSLEKKMMEIIKRNNLPYRFTGNGDFFIGRKNPDFVNVNGEKIAIEVFYKKHKCIMAKDKVKKEVDFNILEKWKKDREEIFNSFGWKIFFFDETEVNEENIKQILIRGD